MPTIHQKLLIQAPPARVFDLARSVDLHIESAGGTQERAVGEVTSGLLKLGDEVTWSGRHFGIRQRLTSRITAFDRPHHFRDSMIRGAFSRFDHDHWFEEAPEGCRMRDRFNFDSPWGILGRLANRLFLTRYLEGFLCRRGEVIKQVAESPDWRRFLPESAEP